MNKDVGKMRAKRRDRLQIAAEILEIAKDGAFKTQILYKANLSLVQLNEYLSLLLEINLLEAIARDGRKVYKITTKGLQYLQSYEEITGLLKGELGTG